MCIASKSFQESPILFLNSLLAAFQNVLDSVYVNCSSPMLKPAAPTLIWKCNCAKETDNYKLWSQTAQLLQRAIYWDPKFNKPRLKWWSKYVEVGQETHKGNIWNKGR